MNRYFVVVMGKIRFFGIRKKDSVWVKECGVTPYVLASKKKKIVLPKNGSLLKF